MSPIDRGLLDSIGAAVIIVDAKTHLIEQANATALKLMGRTPEETIGRSCHGFICPSGAGSCPFTDLGQEIDNAAQILLGAQERIIPVLKSVKLIDSNSGKLLLETFVDTSQKKQLEAELQENRGRLSLALESANMGAWHWYLERNVRHFDPQVCQLLGIDHAEFHGSPEEFFSVVEPADREGIRVALRATVEQGLPYRSEYRVRWRDGSLHHIAARGRLTRDSDGKPVRLDGLLWDQTDRVAMEQALRDSEARFRQLAEVFPETIFETDASGNIVYTNDHGLRVYGYERSDLTRGVNLLDLVSPEDRPRAAQRLRERLDGAVGGYQEVRALRKNGDTFDALTYAAPIAMGGKMVGVRGFVLNITERKMAERELRHTVEQLERQTSRANEMAVRAEAANSAKSDFLANVSHELRTPLNGALGMLELLLDTELTERQRQFATMAQASGQTLLTLVNDILDFSNLEAGGLAVEPLDFDLRVTLADFAELMVLRASEKSIDFSCTIATDVPRLLRGDPVRLRQILSKLVGNAIKFTSQGFVRVEVDLARDSADSVLLRFTVSDSGIGIRADKLELLFNKFTQLDASTTRRFGGTGLGLAIAKQLTELMGGTIGCRSIEGKGSTFEFTCRFAKQAAATAVAPRTKDTSAPATNLSSVHILVAEDNATNQRVALGLLTKLGYRADAVASGREALQALQRTHYDLVLMDVQMPDMDGLEATQRIRSDSNLTLNPNVPIIAMTAHAMRGDREECLRAGMNDHVSKPISTTSIARIIAKWL